MRSFIRVVLLALSVGACATPRRQAYDVNAVVPMCTAPWIAADVARMPAWPASLGSYGSRPEDAPPRDSIMAWLAGTHRFWQVVTEGVLTPEVRPATLHVRGERVPADQPIGTLVFARDRLPVTLDFDPAEDRFELHLPVRGTLDMRGAIFFVSRMARLHDRWMLGGRWVIRNTIVATVPRLQGVDFLEREAGYFCATRPRDDL